MWRICVLFSVVPVSFAQWYDVVVDAGSSGSRLRIFNASREGDVTEVQPRRDDASIFETEPGLASFAGHPEGAGASLAGLVAAAKAYIPKPDYPRTRIWLKATAGMRVLPQERLDAIFRSVQRFLSDERNCPFQLMSTGVLAGENEAVYAFLGINAMVTPTPERSSGVLDMGGGSIQVAYKPHGNILDGEFHFYLREERQSVYARSWPQFGLDTALERALVAELRAAGPEATAIEFACFHQGFSETMDLDGRRIHVTGSGDNEKCDKLSLRLLHREYDCLLPPCPFMGVHMPQLTGREHFYAMSNFFYVPNGLGLVGWDEPTALQPARLKAATEAFCLRSFQNVSGMESRQALKYRRKFCFGGHYMWHVLKAFGFEDDSTAVTAIRMLHGGEADWTLGFVLYETEEMPRRLPEPMEMAPLRMIGAPVVPVVPPAPAAAAPSPPDRLSNLERGDSPAPAAAVVAGQPCPAPKVITVPVDGEAGGGIWLGQAPSLFGIPGWYIWVAALFVAVMFGRLAHHFPIHQCFCCGAYMYDEGPLPMSPVRHAMARYSSVGPVLPAGSTTILLGGQSPILRGQSPKLGGQSPPFQLDAPSPRLLDRTGPHSPKVSPSSPVAGQRPGFSMQSRLKREVTYGLDSAV